MKKSIIALMVVCGILSAGEVFKERGFLLSANMLKANNIPEMEKIAGRAAKAGYNTVYLDDYKFGTAWKFGDKYAANVKKVAEILRKHNFKIVVGGMPITDSCSYLSDVPEFAESLKVVDEPYTVKNGVFTPQGMMVNGSFEEGVKGWRLDPRVDISVDSTCAASGKNSLHFKVMGKEPGRQLRVWYEFKCKPFQQLALTYKVKTKNMQGSRPSFGIASVAVGKVPGLPDGFRYLTHRTKTPFERLPLKSTNDWREVRLVFNTFEFSKVSIALGCWSGKSGEFWIDDVRIEPASFLNVNRRKECAVKVTSADGKITYTEGKDYSKIVDPKMGRVRWVGDFNDAHTGPVVKVLPGSRIKEGDTVLASYYHVGLSRNSASICLNNPATLKYITRAVEWLQKTIQPDGFLIGIDEHRAYGYDPECEKSGMNAAQALNKIARYCHKEIKRIAPKADIYMWNDMFDPFSNCKKGRYYYLIKDKDALWNSWVGLPKDIIILRWSPDSKAGAAKSMEHWQKLGMKFIEFPGYFDSAVFNPASESILETAKENPCCAGAAFAQWSGLKGYRPHFEEFVKLLDKVEKKK